MENWQPKIIAFLCNWCSYSAADLAGVSRLAYPSNVRIIRIPCTGRMSVKFVLDALRYGADGVWVSGCHPGECHYLEGNYYARRKFVLLKSFLEHTGIEPGRVQFSWVSSSEATKFVDVANKVTAEVKTLGPAKHLVKTMLKVA
jgi:F420-non-reducing hydrogenase iron-sulfur subunit